MQPRNDQTVSHQLAGMRCLCELQLLRCLLQRLLLQLLAGRHRQCWCLARIQGMTQPSGAWLMQVTGPCLQWYGVL